MQGIQKQQQQQQQQIKGSSEEDESIPHFNNNESNSSSISNNNGAQNSSSMERRNLEFAHKLGYSDQIVHAALERLGSDAKQNELLAELIKLTADEPKVSASSANNATKAIPTNSGNHATLNSSNCQLRHIVIDGSNVALAHGNNEIFSCRGIRICVDWFRKRGHREINAFVPQWRKESPRALGNIADKEILYELERERVLVFTPSRLLEGKRVSCYDDRYILKLAAVTDGVVVSNDNYRDLAAENAEFRKVVQERILMYSFVNDRFMPPDDPMGRSGPTLDSFLRKQTALQGDSVPICPYGKKCTYGNKCKFRHQQTNAHTMLQRASLSAPLNLNPASTIGGSNNNAKNLPVPLSRTKSSITDKQIISIQHSLSVFPTNNGNNARNSTSLLNDQLLSNQFNSSLDLQQKNQDDTNRHKKLQRQTPTNNLNGYKAHHQLISSASAPLQTLSALPLHSNITQTNTKASKHIVVSRIPSAPVAPADDANMLYLQPINNCAYLSASDSCINEELLRTRTRAEKRCLLSYHLSNLFPQDQVKTVFQMYPEETDARVLCSAILNLFPDN